VTQQYFDNPRISTEVLVKLTIAVAEEEVVVPGAESSSSIYLPDTCYWRPLEDSQDGSCQELFLELAKKTLK